MKCLTRRCLRLDLPVPVTTLLLVAEAEGVAYLVYRDTKLTETARPQTQRL